MMFTRPFNAARRLAHLRATAFAITVLTGTFCQAAIIFDPDGLGSADAIAGVTSLDWAPGNALARDAGTRIAEYLNSGGTSQTPFTTFYQAKLIGLLEQGGQAPTPAGLNTDYEITVVARFDQKVVLASAIEGIASQATFMVAPSDEAFVEIYAHPIGALPLADDLSGVGFNDGIRILTGVITSGISSFSVDLTKGTANLDNSPLNEGGNDDYPGIDTVIGQGGSQLEIDVTSFDSNFFLSAPGSLELAFEGSTSVPFTSVDPSGMFVTDPYTALGASPTAAGAGTAELGQINGGLSLVNDVWTPSGPSVQFQADGNSSINGLQIPEPTTAAMVCAAMLLTIGVRRRGRAS